MNRVVDDTGREHAGRDVNTMLEADVESDIADRGLQPKALGVGPDDDEDIDVRVGSRIATCLRPEQPEAHDVLAEFVTDPVRESANRAGIHGPE